MADRLKDLFFTASTLTALAQSLKKAEPSFQPERFLGLVFDRKWSSLELKERMHHVARILHETLPASYVRALEALKKVAPSTRGFECMVFPDFVEMFGQDEWERSLAALGYFTRFGSSEFAVRPFLARDPARALVWMRRWAKDPDPKVRRLASEGSRPRLPWAMALPEFKKDPRPLLEILEKLKNDPDEAVRRSVANSLNDIAKDNPDITLDVSERWYGRSALTDGIVRHACRGLLKRGNGRALKLFGLGGPAPASIKDFRISPVRLRAGDTLQFTFDIRVGGKKRTAPPRVRLEYRVDYVRSNGKMSGKVFHLSEKEYAPGVYTVKKIHSLADRSTRKHYPGIHRITVLVNGVEEASGKFTLIGGRPAKVLNSRGRTVWRR